MEEKLRNFTYGMTLVIGIILSIIYYFSLYDDGSALEAQIKMAQDQLTANKNEIESLKTAIQDAERFKQVMTTLGAEMERILLAIPTKLTSLDLMKIISTEAKGVGVDIKSLTSQQTSAPSTKDAKQFYEPVAVEVAIMGSYNQVMMFLSNLTRLDKIVIARNLTLDATQSGSTDANSPIVNMKALIEAFRYVSETSKAEGENAK